jgi:hypothetical protein
MKNKFVLTALLALLVPAMMGCSTIIRTTDERYPPKDSYMVKILFETPKEPYEGIARLTVSKFYWFPVVWPKRSSKIQHELQFKAGNIGGEAIINVTEDFASISGVVIVFKKQAAAAQAPQ